MGDDNDNSGGSDGKPHQDQRGDAQNGAQNAESETPSNGVRPLDHRGRDEVRDGRDHQAYRYAKEENPLAQIGRAEWIMIAFTAVTAVAACGGMLINYGQWGTSRDQLKFAEKASADSARDTQQALNVAQRAAAAAERQSATTERALGISDRVARSSEASSRSSAEQARNYAEALNTQRKILRFEQTGQVQVDTTPMEEFGPGKAPSVGLEIKNIGDVPLRVRSFYQYEFGPLNAPITTWAVYRKRMSPWIIIPRGVARYRAMPPVILSQSDIDSIARGINSLRISAVVEYTDSVNGPKTVYMCREWYGSEASNPFPRLCMTPAEH